MMTIEILETRVSNDSTGQPVTRHADIIITSGPNSYLWSVGDLPLTGDLQAILDAREAELWASAEAGGRVVDLYEFTIKRVLKAFALVVMDELNIVRQNPTAVLPARTAAQIEGALRAKLKGMA